VNIFSAFDSKERKHIMFIVKRRKIMQNCECNLTKKIVYTLILIGALNWGLVGAFRFDLVAYFLGDMTVASRIVYMLVGFAALCKIVYLLKNCKK
jgi:uncharacterized membrane protein YuzA (DUF378 family)